MTLGGNNKPERKNCAKSLNGTLKMNCRLENLGSSNRSFGNSIDTLIYVANQIKKKSV